MAENESKPTAAPAAQPVPASTEVLATGDGASHQVAKQSTQDSASREPTLAEKTELAVAEGHDADIPSNIGYVLDEAGEEKRRMSIARQRSKAESVGSHREREHSVEHRDVEKEAATTVEGSGGEGEGATSEDDANVVWWDGPDDPENPYNWPTWKKILNCGLISAFTFVTPLASCRVLPPTLFSPVAIEWFC